MSSATTSICRSLMLEIERWREAVDWPMDKFSEYAGLPDRYYGKALLSDTPSGRQPRWQSVQLMVDALFPEGFDIELRPKPGTRLTAEGLKAKLLQLRAPKDPKTQRELMRELGRKGAIKSATVRKDKAVQRRRVREQRQHAARMRWSTPEIIEITGLPESLPIEREARLGTRRRWRGNRPAGV